MENLDILNRLHEALKDFIVNFDSNTLAFEEACEMLLSISILIKHEKEK